MNRHFPVGILQFSHLSHSPSTQVVFLATLEGQVLAVFPSSVWRKMKAQRILPSNALTKAASLQVVVCSLLEREIPVEDLMMPVWAGYLRPELVSQVNFSMEDIDVEYVFEAECESLVLPAAQDLGEAMNEYFSFVSASDGLQQSQALNTMDGSATALATAVPEAATGSADVPSRLTRLEQMMEKMSTSINKMATGATPKPRASAMKSPATKSTAAGNNPRVTFASAASPRRKSATRSGGVVEQYPRLDPNVVRAATQAGLGSEVLAQLNHLVGQNPKGGRMGDINTAITTWIPYPIKRERIGRLQLRTARPTILVQQILETRETRCKLLSSS